jgi:hypothetical protein
MVEFNLERFDQQPVDDVTREIIIYFSGFEVAEEQRVARRSAFFDSYYEFLNEKEKWKLLSEIENAKKSFGEQDLRVEFNKSKLRSFEVKEGLFKFTVDMNQKIPGYNEEKERLDIALDCLEHSCNEKIREENEGISENKIYEAGRKKYDQSLRKVFTALVEPSK